MDVNHVQSALCFPTFPRFCGQTFTEAKDRELGLLCVRAYNDWMVEEWCGPQAAGRLIPLTLIPLWDAELAARGGAPQRRPRRTRRRLLRDTAAPRTALRPHRRVGPLPRGLRRDRHGHRHAHRVQQPDAVDLRGRPAGRRLHHHLRQLLLLDGGLADERQVRALPEPQGHVRGGPDRLDPVHPRARRRGLGGEPRLGRRRRQGPPAAVRTLHRARLRLLLRRRLRAEEPRRDRRGRTCCTRPTTPTPTPPGRSRREVGEAQMGHLDADVVDRIVRRQRDRAPGADGGRAVGRTGR